MANAVNALHRNKLELQYCGWVAAHDFLMLFWQLIVNAVVAVTRLLSRDGGMARDHGAPEAGQLPRPGLEVAEKKNCRRASGSKIPQQDNAERNV